MQVGEASLEHLGVLLLNLHGCKSLGKKFQCMPMVIIYLHDLLREIACQAERYPFSSRFRVISHEPHVEIWDKCVQKRYPQV